MIRETKLEGAMESFNRCVRLIPPGLYNANIKHTKHEPRKTHGKTRTPQPVGDLGVFLGGIEETQRWHRFDWQLKGSTFHLVKTTKCTGIGYGWSGRLFFFWQCFKRCGIFVEAKLQRIPIIINQFIQHNPTN